MASSPQVCIFIMLAWESYVLQDFSAQCTWMYSIPKMAFSVKNNSTHLRFGETAMHLAAELVIGVSEQAWWSSHLGMAWWAWKVGILSQGRQPVIICVKSPLWTKIYLNLAKYCKIGQNSLWTETVAVSVADPALLLAVHKTWKIVIIYILI